MINGIGIFLIEMTLWLAALGRIPSQGLRRLPTSLTSSG